LSHHEVIILGAGPAGLGVAASLEGWHPYDNNGKNLLNINTKHLSDNGVRPIAHFRELHHPEDKHDPNALELFCDANPDEPECLVYDD